MEEGGGRNSATRDYKANADILRADVQRKEAKVDAWQLYCGIAGRDEPVVSTAAFQAEECVRKYPSTFFKTTALTTDPLQRATGF